MRRLRNICGKPSPVKRFVAVLILMVVFGGFNVWFIVNSVYNIGKNDARKEFLKIEHIEQLKFRNDSVKQFKNQMYEYEQSNK